MRTLKSLMIGVVLGVALGVGGVGIADAPSTPAAVPATRTSRENKVAIVSTFSGGKKAQKELDEAIETGTKDGWNIVSTSAVITGSVVSHYIYFERERATP